MGKRPARLVFEYDSMADFIQDSGDDNYDAGIARIGGELIPIMNQGIRYKNKLLKQLNKTDVPYFRVDNIIYVTKTGNDTTGNGSSGAPYLTLAKAYLVAADNTKILLGDGTYVDTDLHASLGYIQIAKSIWIDAVNPFGATIKAKAGANSPIRLNGTSGKHIVLGKNLVVDAAVDAVTSNNYCVFADNTTSVMILVALSKFINPALRHLQLDPVNYLHLVMRYPKFETTSTLQTRTCVYARSLKAGSIIDIAFPSGKLLNQSTAGEGPILIKAIETGVVCKIQNPDFEISLNTGLTGSAAHYGIQVLNIDNAEVLFPKVKFNNSVTPRTANLVEINVDTAGLTAHNGKILWLDLVNKTIGGRLATIGSDNNVSGIETDACLNGEIAYGHIEGCGLVAQHGAMIGHQESGRIHDIDITLCGIPTLAKDPGSAGRGKSIRVFNNNISKCITAGQALRAKGSAAKFYQNNIIIEAGYNPTPMWADLAVQGASYVDNTIEISTGVVSVANVANDSTASFDGNVYIIDGVSLNDLAFVHPIGSKTVFDHLEMYPTDKILLAI